MGEVPYLFWLDATFPVRLEVACLMLQHGYLFYLLLVEFVCTRSTSLWKTMVVFRFLSGVDDQYNYLQTNSKPEPIPKARSLQEYPRDGQCRHLVQKKVSLPYYHAKQSRDYHYLNP